MLGLFLLAFCFTLTVSANDGIASKTLNGIVFTKSEDIVMKKEVLTISPDKITVKYIFKNVSPNDIKATVAFPIPAFNCDHFGDLRTASDFETKVNGTKVDYKSEAKAIFTSIFTKTKKYKEGEDITGILKKLKVPADCREMKYNDDLHKKLSKLELGDFPSDDPHYHHWNTKITYYWDQLFPSGKEIAVEHSYKPVVGMAAGYDEKCAQLFKKHDPKWVPQMSMRWINYILKTANTWKGPIESFNLELKPGNLDKNAVSNIGGLSRSISKKNFSPTEDLFVCFESRI